jgi:hypothetical protein
LPKQEMFRFAQQDKWSAHFHRGVLVSALHWTW